MPTTASKDAVRLIADKMDVGQNRNALTVAGVYVGTADVSGNQTVVSIYVNATDGQDVTIHISNPTPTMNSFQVTHGTDLPSVITQDLSVVQAFIIYVDGRLLIDGSIAETTKLSINSSADAIITNDLKYQSGTVGPNTVLGLVSWTGNILVSKDIAPPVGQSVKNLTLHGVMMAVNGAFGAQGYDDFATNYPGGYKGTITHIGAFIRLWNLPTLSSDGTRGWGIQTAYDPYLAQSKAPPFFPGNGAYKMINQNLADVAEIYLIKRQ
jgi:hypothetical protein